MAIQNAWNARLDGSPTVLAGDGNAAGPRSAPGRDAAMNVLRRLAGVRRCARTLPATRRERLLPRLENAFLTTVVGGALVGCGGASAPPLDLPSVVSSSAHAVGDAPPPTLAVTTSAASGGAGLLASSVTNSTPTDADAARAGADDLGDITGLDSPQFPTNALDGDGDAVDYYSFTLTDAKKVGLALRQLDANADIHLEDAEGTVLHSSTAQGTAKEWISATLPAGTYYVRVQAQETGDNQYVFRYGVSAPDLADLTVPTTTTDTEVVETTRRSSKPRRRSSKPRRRSSKPIRRSSKPIVETDTDLDETYETLESVRREYTASDSFLMRLAFSRRFVSTIDAHLTAGQSGNHVLRIPDITPFSGTYPLANKVSGWNAQDHEIAWPSLVLENQPSVFGNDHDIALAYSKSHASGSDLTYAGYGWWAISPERNDVTFRPRLVTAFGGLSHGIDTRADDMPGSTDTPITATWRGRATGHVLGKGARWALSGEAELTATLRGDDGGEVQGEITNTRIVEVGVHTVRVGNRTAGDWHTITLSSAEVQGNTYSGTAAIKDPIVTDPVTGKNIVPDGFAGPLMKAPIVGHYEGAFYGPDAVETAGRGYLLRDIGAVHTTDNSVVFGFGAKQ